MTERLTVPVARACVRVGVTANALTALGLVVTLIGVGVVVAGAPVIGGLVMATGLLTDAVDGAVAREQGRPTRFGSFFDSVADRVGDAAVFGLLVWLVADRPVLLAIALVAFAAALITSYVRAKAESLGWRASVGLLERPERMVILVVGVVFDLVPVAVVVLAVGGVATVLQRVIAVREQAQRPAAAVHGPPTPVAARRSARRRARRAARHAADDARASRRDGARARRARRSAR
ncbi:CDP-alcohol phosphatidyltransferase family protein [Egibacter rhizosphaerae]|uniref:CDP-alcohol phosphatidyltransferase family protein n=1 Tax=Egibacter rhizosphaerae TaxID=1670831 RepID=UPI0013F149AA|nr:CDP-alcohol phosphatidyltransferase family protein [Egibacter rhizosphaerae]